MANIEGLGLQRLVQQTIREQVLLTVCQCCVKKVQDI